MTAELELVAGALGVSADAQAPSRAGRRERRPEPGADGVRGHRVRGRRVRGRRVHPPAPGGGRSGVSDSRSGCAYRRCHVLKAQAPLWARPCPRPAGRWRRERPSSARRSGGQPGLRGLGPAVLQRARRLGGNGSATLQPGSGIMRDKRCFLSELRGEAASTHLLNVLRGMGAV